jgi:peptide/nickel transport system substrate-binding protein
VVLYNIFETLTKIRQRRQHSPLLAQSWTVTPTTRPGPSSCARGAVPQRRALQRRGTVKFSLRARRRRGQPEQGQGGFANIEHRATDDLTVVLTLKNGNPDLLFQLGQATAVIVEPKSAATNATQPVGTGPYRLEQLGQGLGITLVLTRWPATAMPRPSRCAA